MTIQSFGLTKVQAIPVSILFMLPYFGFFISLFDGVTGTKTLFFCFFLGVVFVFLDVIRSGETAYLVFFHKRTNEIWDDGLCLVPRLFPFLRNINLEPAYGLQKSYREESYSRQDNENLVFINQRLPSYRVNSNASLATATTARVFGNLFSWLFNVRQGNPDLLFQRVGTRLILVSVVFAFCSGKVWGTKDTEKLFSNFQTSFFSGSDQQTKLPEKTSDDGTIRVMTRIVLDVKKPKTLPEPSLFQNKNKTLKAITIDGVQWMIYPGDQEKKGYVKIDEHTCIAIPPGKDVVFQSEVPPVYAINMRDKITYIGNKEVAFIWKLYAFVTGEQEYYATMNYEESVHKWGRVKEDTFQIFESLPQSKIPDERIGGAVCFL